MAKSTKINRLSVLYKSIDQTQLSEQAKTVLNKLRLATGNFRSKDEESNKAFETFYNKLLEKKPLAIRTSKEYKYHVRAKKAEIARKAREARKSKEESRQGQGSEKDANRPAKPYGWRLRGKHNYRKPTREQIRNGEAYYEGRVNRADVKRRKFPMLERGGYMTKGGEIKYSTYENKSMEYIEGEIAHTERSARQFQQMGDYESMEDRKEHVRKLREIYNRKRAESKMAEGGEMDEDEGVDLFEDYDDQPAEVSAILEKYDIDDANYETLKELNDKLKSVGYTFEYGLDGYAYDLRKIGQKGKSEFYAKGGIVYTDLKDIPNLMDRVERGYVTYRGLGAFKDGTEITVDGKKYIVTDEDFNSIARDKDGNMRIRFSAPSRKRYSKGGEVFYKESHKIGM